MKEVEGSKLKVESPGFQLSTFNFSGFPVHPFFFALSPVLFLYAHNVGRIPVSAGELVVPVLITLAVAAALLLLGSLILRDPLRAGLLAALLIVLGFAYGRAAEALVSAGVGHGFMLLAWLLLFVLGILLIVRTRRSLKGLTKVLNAITGVILAVNIVAGLPSLAKARAARGDGRGARDEASGFLTTHPSSLIPYPDIYYIILDSYVRSDFMKARFGYDNSDFINFLTRNGFYVAPRGRSNYESTYFSLASSLNFTYLDSVVAQVDKTSRDLGPLIRMIEHNRVAEFLRRRGYSIASFSSGYTGTDLADADVNFKPRRATSEFRNLLLGTTIIPPLLGLLAPQFSTNGHRARVLFTLHTIPEAAEGRHPAFVFAHIVCPHTPFVFGAHGEPVRIAQDLGLDDDDDLEFQNETRHGALQRQYYGPQAAYLSSLVQEMVTQILVQSPVSPVIILQGDHGTRPARDPGQGKSARYAERHAILNAIRIPPAACRLPLADCGLYDSITPVNTFRVLFTRLFDTSLALLPDKCYSPEGEPYRLFDIDALQSGRTGRTQNTEQ